MANVRLIFPLRGFCLALLLMAGAVWAAPLTYMGQSPVNSQSDEDRTAALKTALAEVVIRQTGDPGVLARADVASAVAHAERYVLQYQYRDNPAAGEGGARMILVAEFDRGAVDRMLQQLGLIEGEQSAMPAVPSEATVWIGGIRNGEDYVHVMAYLSRSNFVRGVQPIRAQGDGMLVQLSLATGLAGFLGAVELERTFTQGSVPVEGADAVLILAP